MLKLLWTALTAGIFGALIFAGLLGALENFNYDVTGRSLAVGTAIALVTFLVIGTKSAVKRYRYWRRSMSARRSTSNRLLSD